MKRSILFYSLVESVVTVLYIHGQTCSKCRIVVSIRSIKKMHFLTTTFICLTVEVLGIFIVFS